MVSSKRPKSNVTKAGKGDAKAGAPSRPSVFVSPTIEWEARNGHPTVMVAGVDEVGRGCIAGPVVAAAVVLPPHIDLVGLPWIAEIRDSKLMKAEDRERIAPRIQGWALAWAIAEASLEEIERLNIYHASHLAMTRALEALKCRRGRPLSHALVDGNVVPQGLPCSATAIIKGDQHCLSIAAASVIAKVHRDRFMIGLELTYPGYGFAAHKGYGTPAHLEALKRLGKTGIHRSSFAPVAAAEEASQLVMEL